MCPPSWTLQYSCPSKALFLHALPVLVIPLHSWRPVIELGEKQKRSVSIVRGIWSVREGERLPVADEWRSGTCTSWVVHNVSGVVRWVKNNSQVPQRNFIHKCLKRRNISNMTDYNTVKISASPPLQPSFRLDVLTADNGASLVGVHWLATTKPGRNLDSAFGFLAGGDIDEMPKSPAHIWTH